MESAKELEGLLDEALGGFSEPSAPVVESLPAAVAAQGSKDPTASEQSGETAASTSGRLEALEFDPLKKPSRRKMKELAPEKEEDFLKLQPERLAKEMAELMADLSDETTGQAQKVNGEEKFLDLAATLSSLAEKTRETAGPEVVPDTVNDAILGKLTEQMGAMQDTPEVQSLIDGLMQQLLSKEVLYQPMKDIADKYPAWLEKNRSTIEPEELAMYSEQYDNIQKVCAFYEGGTSDFDQLVVLMQQVQACGQPPQDIVTELAPGLSFGPDGLPQFPSIPGGPGPDQCAIM